MYSRSQYEGWVTLDDHLKNPVNFPKGITSGFFVVFSPPLGLEDKYPWKVGEAVMFMGEIPGMRGHGIFAGDDGLVRWGYHLDSFHVIPEDEL